MTKTQLVVIGAGPGGYAAAFLAADKGMNVTLIDKEKNPGGVCLYRGCIPSKALLHISKLISEAAESHKWGVTFGKPKIDLDKIRQHKNNVVLKLTNGTGQLAKQRKINYIQGTAKFLNSETVQVIDVDENEQNIFFENAILATGSVPSTVPGLSIKSDKIWDSTSALNLETIPGRLLVIGGGYIGLELGSVYASLGSKVTVVEMMPYLLPGADQDLVRVLHKSLESKFEKIYLNTKVISFDEVKDKIKIKFDGEGIENPEQNFDRVLISVGRKPITDGLGLEKTKVKLTKRGFVEIDNKCQTSDPKIFAIGDIVGGAMLAHKASAEGKVAVEAILGHKVAFEPNAIPAVVFTDPEIAWAGLTESEAKEKGIKVEVARFPWAASGRATTIDRNDGLTKLLIDPATQRILGMGIVGAGAGEMISEGVLAIEMSALAKDIALSIHPHPTLSETVMESAEIFFGESTHLYRPKRK
ncbi:MAG: dihydrolipoyl dehydrogenase [Bacteroidetes bacterium]|nr:dihydrolipoyl dehydrogenase [Bacteroidota bacterium]MBU2507074.1 dihydrolipoyl dehydrogenase [Bacteroidota bacterium]